MNSNAEAETTPMASASSDHGGESRTPSRRGDHPDHRFPGWYTDPMTPVMERFWDGLRWTEHVRAGAEALADDTGPIEPTLARLLAI